MTYYVITKAGKPLLIDGPIVRTGEPFAYVGRLAPIDGRIVLVNVTRGYNRMRKTDA